MRMTGRVGASRRVHACQDSGHIRLVGEMALLPRILLFAEDPDFTQGPSVIWNGLPDGAGSTRHSMNSLGTGVPGANRTGSWRHHVAAWLGGSGRELGFTLLRLRPMITPG